MEDSTYHKMLQLQFRRVKKIQDNSVHCKHWHTVPKNNIKNNYMNMRIACTLSQKNHENSMHYMHSAHCSKYYLNLRIYGKVLSIFICTVQYLQTWSLLMICRQKKMHKLHRENDKNFHTKREKINV